jgi:predicted ATPase with chaperone activity
MSTFDNLVAPATLEQAGLSLDLVTQLALKTLFFAGELSGGDLAKRLGVNFGVVEPALEFLKAQRRCEIVGGAIAGGPSYRYVITTEGRSVAALFLQQSQYVGVAPVPLPQYVEYMASRSRSVDAAVTRDEVRQGFSHLVLGDAVLDEIGPAINGGQSIFIYGPPGNGKTVIAQALRNLLAGDIEIPHALEVEGNIIRVFDPVNHEKRRADQDGADLMVTPGGKKDHRWVTCRRPMVKTGGELALESLKLTFDPRLGYYHAPLQLIANGGMLLIDDFGRQRCEPRDLLNRWMVPLESGVDHLTLQSGVTFEVPFQVFVAFATNIKPSELVDEAFLRRVRYKVFAKGPSVEEFIEIAANYCRERSLTFDRAVVEQLLDGYFHSHGVARRACHPRDLINQALLLAAYRNGPRELTLDLLESACAAYFVEESW